MGTLRCFFGRCFFTHFYTATDKIFFNFLPVCRIRIAHFNIYVCTMYIRTWVDTSMFMLAPYEQSRNENARNVGCAFTPFEMVKNIAEINTSSDSCQIYR